MLPLIPVNSGILRILESQNANDEKRIPFYSLVALHL